jgi:SAM-dependent methyltransferase
MSSGSQGQFDAPVRRTANASLLAIQNSDLDYSRTGREMRAGEPRRCRLCGKRGGLVVALEGRPSSLLKCKECGVAFVNPLPDPAAISEHFRNDYITDAVHLEKIYGELRRAALERIATQVKRRRSGGRILDVGCAGGYFLDRYFDSAKWEKFGIEPSRYALRRAASRGIQTFEGEVSTVDIPAAYFDVITVAGVLPYFREPNRELRILQRALKPGGLIVLELPLGATQIWRHTTPLGRMTGGGWRSLLNSPHLFYYDRKSLVFLLSQPGFQLESLSPSPGNDQVKALHQILFRSYFWMSNTVAALTAERWMLGPGVIVTAINS